MFLAISLIKSDPAIAFCIAALIFFITIFLVAKQYIGFSVAFLLLLFSLVVGIVMSHRLIISSGPEGQLQIDGQTNQQAIEDFQAQIKETIDNIEKELKTEKENMSSLMNQVNQIIDIVDTEKQKLQHFIEETKEKFQAENPTEKQPTVTAPEKGTQ